MSHAVGLAVVTVVLWTVAVMPVLGHVLADLSGPNYTANEQTKDFILSVPLQVLALRSGWDGILFLADTYWAAGRAILLKGLGVPKPLPEVSSPINARFDAETGCLVEPPERWVV
jgi:hypothetical protein